MTKYSRRIPLRNQQLDLFEWHREYELRRANPVARKIASRYGLNLEHAATVAELAGFGVEVMR